MVGFEKRGGKVGSVVAVAGQSARGGREDSETSEGASLKIFFWHIPCRGVNNCYLHLTFEFPIAINGQMGSHMGRSVMCTGVQYVFSVDPM